MKNISKAPPSILCVCKKIKFKEKENTLLFYNICNFTSSFRIFQNNFHLLIVSPVSAKRSKKTLHVHLNKILILGKTLHSSYLVTIDMSFIWIPYNFAFYFYQYLCKTIKIDSISQKVFKCVGKRKLVFKKINMIFDL